MPWYYDEITYPIHPLSHGSLVNAGITSTAHLLNQFCQALPKCVDRLKHTLVVWCNCRRAEFGRNKLRPPSRSTCSTRKGCRWSNYWMSARTRTTSTSRNLWSCGSRPRKPTTIHTISRSQRIISFGMVFLPTLTGWMTVSAGSSRSLHKQNVHIKIIPVAKPNKDIV